MSDNARSIRIHGATVASQVLVRCLETAGVSTDKVDGDQPDPNLLRLATAASLSPLNAAGFSTTRIESHWKRQLTEIDFEDSDSVGPEMFVVRPERAVHNAQHPQPESDQPFVMKVFTGPSRAGEHWSSPEAVQLTLELQWDATTESTHSVVELSGEHLDEVTGSAVVISVPGLTSLLLTVPMSVLVEQSIAIADVAWRLLDHPGVQSAIPAQQFTRTASFMTLRDPIPPIDRYSSRSILIGAAAGLADPVNLDREVSSAVGAADLLVEAFRANRWSSAGLSRIGRASV